MARKTKQTGESFAILKNAISGEVIRVTSAKVVGPNGKKVNLLVDESGKPVCIIRNELPAWEPISVNGKPVTRQGDNSPVLPVGLLSR